jgi:hypothetical protein
MQRTVIGCGGGVSDANLCVSVADLAHSHGKGDLLDFDVKSQSNKMPGGGIAMERNSSERDINVPCNASPMS